MRLPSFKRLRTEDYSQENRGLIDKLSGVLNIGIELLYQALNKELTLRDNLKCTVRDVQVTVDANGIPKQTTSFILDTMGKVDSVIIGKADNLTNSNTYPSSGIMVNWTQNNNSVTINHITGLQANNIYQLRVIAFSQ